MNSTHVMFQIARADFLERVRRYSFLVMLGLAVYLGYLVNSGQIELQLGEYRGLYNSAWVGALMSLTANTFVGLFGFYLVKNTLERDRQTGVGQIIASTPVSKPVYLLGKWLSNGLVLGALLVILALAAAFQQYWQGEVLQLDLWALLSPLLLVTLPLLLLVAALAVVFECLPGLRGGAGNVAYFMLFVSMIPLMVETLPDRLAALDPLGIKLFSGAMGAALNQAVPGAFTGGFSLGSVETKTTRVFTWSGLDWTTEMILSRLVLVAITVGLVLAVSLVFDCFSTTGGERRRLSVWRGARLGGRMLRVAEQDNGRINGAKRGLESAGFLVNEPDNLTVGETAATLPLPAPAIYTSELSPVGRRYTFLPVLAGELRLLLKGRSKWWWLVLVGLQAAALFSSSGDFPILAGLAWIWPLVLWSGMGCREARHHAAELILSAPYPITGQLPAAWLAGVLATAVTGVGVGLHAARIGDMTGLTLWAGAVVFVPSLALAAGVWSGSARLFEVLYLLIWYLGPMNKLSGLDYVGGSPATAATFAALAGVLITVAAVGRLRSMRI